MDPSAQNDTEAMVDRPDKEKGERRSGADRKVYSKLPFLLNIYKLLTHVLVHALLPGDSFLEYICSIEVCVQ